MSKCLKEGYSVSGNNLVDFFTVNQGLWNKFRICKAAGPLVYSYYEDGNENALTYKRLNVSDELAINVKTLSKNKSNFEDKGLGFLFDEVKAAKTPLLMITGFEDENTFFTAPDVIPQAMKIGGHISGHGVHNITRARNEYAEELLNKETLSYIYLKDEGVLKIVAARSRKFTLIPLTVIEDIFYKLMELSDWGEFECKKWSVSVHNSEIWIEFPQLADDIKESYPEIKHRFIPGIMLSLGCTGLSALTAAMTWRREGTEYANISTSVKQKHFEGWSKAEFLENCKNEIWAKYTVFPQAMAKHATSVIELEEGSVYDTVSAIVENVFKKLKINMVFRKKEGEIVKARKVNYGILLKKKIAAALIKQYNELKDAGYDLTYYDVVTAVMDADISGIPESYLAELRETLSSAWTVNCKEVY